MPPLPNHSKVRRPPCRQRGFILVLLLALLAIGFLYAIVSQLNPEDFKAARTGDTADALAQAKAALIGYAATYRDTHSDDVFGYLPCPSLTGSGQAALNCDSSGTTVVGLLPYQTLGLPDLRDGSGNCLWYAVSGSHKYNPKAVPLNWDSQGLIQVQDAQGTVLVQPSDGNGGAVAVIFAPGPPLPGQNRTPNANSPCNVADLTANPNEYRNYLDGVPNASGPNTPYSFPSAANTTTAIAQGASNTLGASNNDQVIWITAKEVFDRVLTRADLGNASASAPPVGQFNKLASLTGAAIELLIQKDLATGSSPSLSLPANGGSNYNQPSAAKVLGDVSSAAAIADPTGTYANYFANWSGQFRQVVCANLSTPCLSVNGTACRGALLFGGTATNSHPCPPAARLPPAPAGKSYPRRACLQNFTTAANSAANLPYYFEPGSGLDILTGPSLSVTSNPVYLTATPSADFAACLFPGTFLSFAQNMGDFAAGTISADGGTPVAAVSSLNQTATLGGGAGAAGSACIWYPKAIPLNSVLRIYFRFQVASRGPGFTMAIADASTNKPTNTNPVMCGGADGAYLGYAAAPPAGVAQDQATSASSNISSVSCSDGTVTIVTLSAFNPTGSVTVSGVTPTAYNGSYSVRVLAPTQFSYSLPSGSCPALPAAGIVPPKLAVEFDTRQDASRNDPADDHMAFVYWGGAADSGPGGSGGDDNVHGAGLLGDGTQPLNPGNPADSPASAQLPGSATAVPIAQASWSAGVATLITSQPHGFATGQYVNIGNLYPAGYNGTYAIAVTGAASFTYSLPTDPGCSYATSALATATRNGNSATVTKALWGSLQGSGEVLVTTAGALPGLQTGNYVTIRGTCPGDYGGKYQVTSVLDPTDFTYSLSANPGAQYFANAVPGIVTAAPLNGTGILSGSGGQMPVNGSSIPLPYNGSTPRNGVIHVRLDVSRSYDATSHLAILNLKAYMADTFGVASNTCAITDFMNLSQDLSSLCTDSTFIERDGIPVMDAVGPALQNVYFGFTTSQGYGDNQNVVISNLQLRSQ